VQVHYSEGVAIHTGPEPCVGTREGDGEASAGERIGMLTIAKVRSGGQQTVVVQHVQRRRRRARRWSLVR
jgi:hypothetical protein